MTKSAGRIRFSAPLLRPASPKGAAWAFIVLPATASAGLSARGMVSVEGTLNGSTFRATLEPDGQGSHWLKLTRKMREAAGVAIGDRVEFEIWPSAQEPEPRVPADLRRALDAAPQARALWSDITALARRDWIQWITSAKRPETRARRIRNACEMLASGKRRVCCFDRSGIYSRGLSAPVAAE